MSHIFIYFTIVAFSFSLALRTYASPISPDVLGSNVAVSYLSRRTNHYGRGTFFYPGLGNCGDWNDSEDPIVAISTQIYHDGANCDQWMEITNTDRGQTAYGLVKDSCPSCSAGSVDMSPAVFEQLAPLDQGVISIEWHYMPRGFSP